MTGTRNPQQDGSIQAMLRDSGLEAATELRSTLDQLQALVPDRAPAPRADLAALLAAGSMDAAERSAAPEEEAEDLSDGVISLAGRRGGRKRRLALIGGAVIGAMGLGAGAVAASSQDFRENVGHTLGVLFQPAAPTRTPAPSGPTPSDLPAVPVPVPAATSPALTRPAEPSAQATAQATKHAGPIATPPAVGRGGELPNPPHRPVQPGAPGQNGRGLAPSPLPTSPEVPGLPTAFPKP
mgnify:CR=1 FL=1